MLIKCKYCPTIFEWTRKSGQRGGRVPTICLSAECRKERDHRCYLKWKANHSYTRYEKKKAPDYEYRNVPKGQQWSCRDCRRMSHNRLYCPACHHRRSKEISQEYSGLIFSDGGENLVDQFEESAR